MLDILSRRADLTILTRADSPRATDSRALAAYVCGPSAATESVEDALELARRLAGPEDAIVITGSFYVAGEALGILSGKA